MSSKKKKPAPSRSSPAPKKRTAKSSKKKAAKSPARAAVPRPDEMDADVLEFITAIDEYKRERQRPFPSWSEILGILKELGYDRSGR